MSKVFFAESNLERSDIYMLEISKKNRKVNKRKVFSLGSRLVAMEADHSNEVIQQTKSTLFVLGEDQILYHIQEDKNVNKDFKIIGQYDYTEYDMQAICRNFWSHSHISKRAITFDEYVYEANSPDEM